MTANELISTLIKFAPRPIRSRLEMSWNILMLRKCLRSREDVLGFINEVANDVPFQNYLETQLIRALSVTKVGGWIDFSLLPYIYALIRMFKPRIIVETGVGPDSSSAFILNALSKNGFGKLYSIDLPGYDAIIYPKIGNHYDIHVPRGFTVGWLIPPWLRHNHELIIGDSEKELPKLLNSLGKIDMFLHDSLHTYEHVMFELRTAWKHVSEGGVIVCDDVCRYWTLAFVDFCKETNLTYCLLSNRLGIARKSTSPKSS